MSESKTGRDHNPWGYSIWLAGGAVRGGMAYGATDAIGLRAVDRPVHPASISCNLASVVGAGSGVLVLFSQRTSTNA